MLILGMVLQCAGTLKFHFESGPVTADLTTTVVHRYKLLRNHVKTLHSGNSRLIKAHFENSGVK